MATKKRSLILAGGGIKVSFQAGVLQVWLDEAGLTFDHVDAASGGVFNLAMMCQGLSGLQIADNWRKLHPAAGVSLNPSAFANLLYAESLFTLDNYRKHVFTGWGLDWDKIRASRMDATFNVFNFSQKELQVIPPEAMSEDMLVACVSLPMWFPPVRMRGQTYIDSVYLTDANIEEAIRRGADELWVIWTVSEKDEWNPGFVANYFQIIETSADGHYRAILKRIAENNEALAKGRKGEFGRRIDVKELKADVPLHYLIDFSQDRLTEAVNLGVHRARQWCQENGIPFKPLAGDFPTDVDEARTTLSFSQELKGHLGRGVVDYEAGLAAGKAQGSALAVKLAITIDGVNRFVTWPDHGTDQVAGTITCPALGGQLGIERGSFNVLVEDRDPSVKRIYLRLYFHDGQGVPCTLSGFHLVKEDPGNDLWQDVTTMFTRVLRGHLTAEEEAVATRDAEGLAELVVGSGVVRIHFFDFQKMLASFRVEGPTFSDRTSALARFGRLYLGKLWDVYAREVLTSGPI
jgi:predicted patatin/cPLA2 family phospholipase